MSTNLFFDPAGGRGERRRRNSFFGAPPETSEPSNLEQLETRAAENERLLEASGGIPQTVLGGLERVSDILLRPNYAVAGGVEEFYNTKDIRAALSRAGTEFFSGIGGLKGEKDLFGDVLETMGVPELGHVSSLLPFLFNDTGNGWRFRAGGPADITGRGTIGFGLDIPFDPLTYMSFGLAPGAGVVLREGAATGIRRFSRAGMKAVRKAYDHESPEALRYARWLGRNMGRGVDEGLELLDAAAPRVKSQAERTLEGQLSLAQRELDETTRLLQQEPLNQTLMAEQIAKRQAVDGVLGQLNEASRVADHWQRAVPATRRLAGLQNPAKEDVLRLARESTLFGAEIAHQAAISKVDDLIRKGASRYADSSVIRFAGQPLMSHERFKAVGRPVSRLFRQLEELPIGAQIASGLRKMTNSKGARTLERQLDGMFNETLKKARGIPGALEARAAFRAESRNLRKANAESVGKLTGGWRKMRLKTPVEFAGRQINRVSEYAALHLDDPQRFPADALPPGVRDQGAQLRQRTADWCEAESSRDAIDPRSFRENYFPHIFDNTDEEMDKLSTLWQSRKGIGFDSRFAKGPWNEQRVFPTFNDAMEFAGQLKREGVIDFDLKPRLDVADVLSRRGDSNASILAAENYYANILNRFGLSDHVVGEKTFQHAFPEIAQMLKSRIQDELARTPPIGAARNLFSGVERDLGRTEALRQRLGITGEQGPQMSFIDELFPPGPRRTEGAVNVGKLLARAQAGKSANLAGLSPELKALYWTGRLTAVTDIKKLQSMMKRHADDIAKLDPEIMEKVRNLLGRGRRTFLASYNEPYKRIASGPYKGMWMPQALAEEADRLGASVLNRKEVGGLLKAWDYTQDLFKGAVTVGFPSFHARNHFSNVATTFTDLGMSAFDPRRMLHVAGLMAGRDGTIQTPIRRYTYNEVRDLFRRFGLETTGPELTERLTRGGGDVILDNPVFKGGRKVGETIENHAKLLNFVAWMERGLEPQQAALRVQRALFDYQQLAPFERDVMRRIFPFYTWTSKNLRLAGEQLLRHPGRISAQLKLADQETGPEREMLPEYLRGDFRVKLHNEGKLTYLTGIDLPFSSAVETVMGVPGRNTFRQTLSSINPAMKAFIELGMKRDLWTGRSLEERQHVGTVMGGIFERMPEGLQQFFELQKGEIDGEPAYSINGLKAYLFLKSYALSRVFSTTAKMESDDMKAWLVDFFTNVDMREFDLTDKQEAILRNRVREWERQLVARGVLVPGRPFLPKTSPYKQSKKKEKAAPGLFMP